jgi:hypothetical protein
MKLRLLMRSGITDYDGKLAEYKYFTAIVEMPIKPIDGKNPPEVIGGEWLIIDRKCTECGWVGKESECEFGHEDFVCPKCGKEALK